MESAPFSLVIKTSAHDVYAIALERVFVNRFNAAAARVSTSRAQGHDVDPGRGWPHVKTMQPRHLNGSRKGFLSPTVPFAKLKAFFVFMAVRRSKSFRDGA